MRQSLSLLALSLRLSLGLASLIKRDATPEVTELLKFPDGARLENFKVLPDGHLLVNTLSSNTVWDLDPTVSNPQPEKVVSLASVDALFGVTPLDKGLYAISGGLHATTPNRFVPGSFRINVIRPSSKTIVDSFSVPDTEFLNGLATLPKKPHVVLGADSYAGRILRIDTRTHEITTAWSHPALSRGDNTTGLQIGVNGIRIKDGHLYFSNSRLGTFSRVLIDEDGIPTAEPDLIATLPGFEDGAHLLDDFDFDAHGNVYMTAHPSSLVKITPDGKLTTVVGGDGTTTLVAPTSAEFTHDKKTLYVMSMTSQVLRVRFC
ncbi:hypothetical protein MFIFM68171_08173 [Madurella fahalii]|uniref:SMP-30/Gluconolactonase/LRE-like region domain-containing protein n=1 Tax=Madurella fahalii TaxID=1157608 RepID=A0ABQ0GJM0_9PEZI